MATDRGKSTLVQRIALDGGDDIKKELESLGKVGEIAFNRLKKAAKNTKLDNGLGRSLALLRVRFREMQAAGRKIGDDFTKIGRVFTQVGRNVTFMGAAIAGAAAAFGLLAKGSLEAADQVGKNAQKVGLAVRQYQNLAGAAKLADVSEQAFSGGLERLSKLLTNGTREVTSHSRAVQDGVRVYSDIGVSVIDATKATQSATKALQDQATAQEDVNDATEDADGVSGKAVEQVRQIIAGSKDAHAALLRLADAFQGMPDGARKTALALAAFRSTDWIPFLNEGAAGVARLEAEIQRVAPGFTEIQTKVADGVLDAMELAGMAAADLRKQIGLAFGKPLETGANALTEFIVRNREQIIAFANDIASRVVPVIEDLLNSFAGNDGAVKNKGILEFRDTVVQLGSDIRHAFEDIIFPIFEKVKAAADTVAQAINGLFGTNVTGGELLITTAILGFVGAITGAITVIGAMLGIVTTLVGLFGGWAVAIGAAVIALGGIIAFNWDAIKETVSNVFNSIVQFAQGLPGRVVAAFNGLVDGIKSIFRDAVNGAIDVLGKLVDRARSIARSVAKIIKDAFSGSSADAPSTPPPGLAGGGPVVGPGGPTADKVLLWGSNGEFMQRAAAVRKYGLAFMHALNRGAISARAVHDLMRGSFARFANGGPVMMRHLVEIPRFANGGSVLSIQGVALSGGLNVTGTPVHIHMPGGQTIDLVALTNAVTGKLVNNIQSAQARAAATQMGQAPFWKNRYLK